MLIPDPGLMVHHMKVPIDTFSYWLHCCADLHMQQRWPHKVGTDGKMDKHEIFTNRLPAKTAKHLDQVK